MFDLQTWLQGPAIYVFDCSAAGLIVSNFLQFARQRERDYEVFVRAVVAVDGLTVCGAQRSRLLPSRVPVAGVWDAVVICHTFCCLT